MKILVVNNVSLDMNKFIVQNQLLFESAKKNNIVLDIKTNMEVWTILSQDGEMLNKPLDCDGVMFYDKDIILARTLENLGYKIFNSAKAIELCDNKALMYQKLAENHIKIPKTIILPLTFYYKKQYFEKFVDDVIETLALPLVVKEWFGSWGKQVYLCKTKDDIFDIIDKTQGKQLLFQEFIEESSGKDIRINIVGDKVVAAMKRQATNGDFQANISNGGTMGKYIPSPEEKEISLKVAKALECDFCGVDLLFGKNGPVVCEANSNAHLLNIYEATNINVAEEILKYIEKNI